MPGMMLPLWLGTGQGLALRSGVQPAGKGMRPSEEQEQVGQASGDLSCSHWAGWT